MSAGYTSQPLVVQPWCNHAETTVGYINGKGSFMPLADCSIGPGYAVDYEPLARLRTFIATQNKEASNG